MHSGMRGGPHVGAFRRCSFTETESNSKRVLRASPVIHLLVSCQQVLMVTLFPSALQLPPELFRTAPLTKLIPSQMGAEEKRMSLLSFLRFSACSAGKGLFQKVPKIEVSAEENNV